MHYWTQIRTWITPPEVFRLGELARGRVVYRFVGGATGGGWVARTTPRCPGAAGARGRSLLYEESVKSVRKGDKGISGDRAMKPRTD